MKKYLGLEVEVVTFTTEVICESPVYGSGGGDDFGGDFWD